VTAVDQSCCSLAGRRSCQLGLNRSGPRAVAIDRQELPGAGHAPPFDAAAVLESGDPTTRPRTVRETRMSPASAWPRMRAAMCTAPMSASSSSHSPVWMPTWISMPNVSASARKASAQRMACVGPSNVMRWPSPVL
jgi:hypothetical protein